MPPTANINKHKGTQSHGNAGFSSHREGLHKVQALPIALRNRSIDHSRDAPWCRDDPPLSEW